MKKLSVLIVALAIVIAAVAIATTKIPVKQGNGLGSKKTSIAEVIETKALEIIHADQIMDLNLN